MNIRNNINFINESLQGKCKLIVVSKTQPIENIQEAYQAGQRIFGENKVQELTTKFDALPKDIHWHMIGHLQSNKVKYIAPFVSLIHSVDSTKLLIEINKQGLKNNRIIHCLLQIHIAEEETKFGFSESEVFDLLQSDDFNNLNNIHIDGLMGMATLTDNTDQVRKEFKNLKNIYEKIKATISNPKVTMKELSMGMSSDFQIAIEEGSTFVRIGTAIFGERMTKK